MGLPSRVRMGKQEGDRRWPPFAGTVGNPAQDLFPLGNPGNVGRIDRRWLRHAIQWSAEGANESVHVRSHTGSAWHHGDLICARLCLGTNFGV